jgi:RNA polymerase sigma factor (sigma-70 family)
MPLGEEFALLKSKKSSKCVSLEAQSQLNDVKFAEKMLEEHYPFLRMKAIEYAPKLSLSEEELVQAGRIGIWKAAQRYEPAKGKFLTYARHFILAQLWESFHANSTVKLPVYKFRQSGKRLPIDSLDEPIALKGGIPCDEFTRASVIPGDSDTFETIASAEEERNEKEGFSEAFEKLPELDKKMLRKYYLQEMTLQEIGDEEGVTREAVRLRLEKAKKRLRRKLDVAI